MSNSSFCIMMAEESKIFFLNRLGRDLKSMVCVTIHRASFMISFLECSFSITSQ